MRVAVPLILAFLACLTLAAVAADSVSFTVARSSAEPGAALPRWGTIYFDVAYHAEQPVRFQASAFENSKLAAKGLAMNGAVVHPAGDGHALAWVSFSEPAIIDAIRVTAYDENFKPLAVVDEPFAARWNAEPAATRAEPPEWVSRLRDEENRISAEYARAHPPAPDPVGDAIVYLMFLSVPGYFIAQALGAFFLRGRWRKAALVPLVLMVPVIAFTIFAVLGGSNLAPIYLIFTAPLAMLYFIGLFAARFAIAGRLSG
jgi:hypothetical protein